MAAPQLFYVDPGVLKVEIITLMESFLGKKLYPGQPEYQIAMCWVNRETNQNARADYALSQVLVDFSNAPMLDYLAGTAGLQRLAASPAETIIRYTLVPGHGGVVIPQGTRVSTTDGKIEFATDIETSIPAGTNTVDINATASTDGVSGNNYAAGTVTTIVDPLAFVSAASNLYITAGGSPQESDESLRTRIKLGPSRSSNAGPVDAYKYHTRTASPTIIDVAVTNPVAGEVHVFPLVAGGITTPTVILDAVEAALNVDTVRPLNDTVVVNSPTRVDYELTVNFVLKYGVVQSETVNRAMSALAIFCEDKAKLLGTDITRSQITAAAMNENIHSLDFGVFADLIIGPTEFAVCTGLYTGTVAYEDINAT